MTGPSAQRAALVVLTAPSRAILGLTCEETRAVPTADAVTAGFVGLADRCQEGTPEARGNRHD